MFHPSQVTVFTEKSVIIYLIDVLVKKNCVGADGSQVINCKDFDLLTFPPSKYSTCLNLSFNLGNSAF